MKCELSQKQSKRYKTNKKNDVVATCFAVYFLSILSRVSIFFFRDNLRVWYIRYRSFNSNYFCYHFNDFPSFKY